MPIEKVNWCRKLALETTILFNKIYNRIKFNKFLFIKFRELEHCIVMIVFCAIKYMIQIMKYRILGILTKDMETKFKQFANVEIVQHNHLFSKRCLDAA